MKPITLLDSENIEGKVALVRVDYNVPIDDKGNITDDFRIKASLHTINYLRDKGAKIILLSHIEGKAGKESDTKPTLEPVSKYDFGFPVTFMSQIPHPDPFDWNEALKNQLVEFAYLGCPLRTAPNGSVYLFENLRNNPGEKSNDSEFGATLASIADLYVGEAFSAAHREHASIVGLPKRLPHYAGFQMLDEVAHLEKGLNPNHPFIFIIGGAKFETKLPLIQKFMQKADRVLIGGALLNDVMKGRGLEVGASLASDAVLPDEILKDPEGKLITPDDVVVKKASGEILIKKINDVSSDESILDAGPSVITKVKEILDGAKATGLKPFVLWNGPLGDYEDGFVDQTVSLAKLIIDSGVDALIGGGDTTAAIAHIKETSPNVYVSTGGGAMIDYLIQETLPGIEALK